MAAAALRPVGAAVPPPCTAVACGLDAAARAALEAALHGRPRDASRGGEAWLGPCRSARRARLAGTPAADLAAAIAARLVQQGVAEAVASSADDVRDAAARGMRRVVLLGGPCRVHAVRTAEPVPGIASLLVIGTGAAAGAPDAVNALADLAVLSPRTSEAWAVVRNARGRAILDALGADLALDAIGPAAFAAAGAAFGAGAGATP